MKKKLLILILVAATGIFGVSCGCKKNDYTQKEEKKEEKKEEEHNGTVTPDLSDKCWTKTVVDDGIIYWEFNGFDAISSAKQFVHVADIDLSKGYKFIIGYDGNSHITSDMHKLRKAVVTINGGYETSSIFIKYEGSVKHKIENNKISGTDVLNWKNDGAICIGSNGRPAIVNSMCGDTEGVSRFGEALDKQRDFYRNGATIKNYPNVISSGPLLIDDYKPYGESFVYMSATQYNALASEHPQHHQGVRHPRTAIALAGTSRLLLLVADGRYSSICNGFSAKELTQFLTKNFNPQYALNMDGGGSSTMCIEDLGDPSTHVVNYPCDNKKADHDGERTVRTFFCVTR